MMKMKRTVFILTLLLTTALALLPVNAQVEEDGAALAEQVLEKYRATLEREDIQDMLPAVLEGFKDPNFQELLEMAGFEIVFADPANFVVTLPNVDRQFVTQLITLLKTDAEIQALFSDVQVQALIQNTVAIDALVSALGGAGPVVAPPVVAPPVVAPVADDSPIHIPDANLAAIIREVRGLGEGAPITAAAMRKLTVLNADDRGVADLTGLQHATQLRTVNLRYNDVSDISVLANLTNLRSLALSYTYVSDISVLANLTKLRWLTLQYTDVSDISALVDLPNLERLYLYGCPLSHASLHTHIPALKAKGIKVGHDGQVVPQLPDPTQGTLFVNIPDLALRSAIKSALNHSTANITEARMRELTRLDGNGWEIADLTGLEHATELEELYLSDTAVSDVSALANLPNLEELHLNDTAVSDVSALANLPNLEELYLDDTNVSDVSALANLPRLVQLGLSGCPLSDTSLHTHIPVLQAKGIEVLLAKLHIPDGRLAYDIRKALGLGKGARITEAAMRELTKFDVSGRKTDWNIADLTGLEHATQLKMLYLSSTNVSDVSALAGLPNLKSLYLENTNVSDVSALANLTNLKWLHLGRTKVSDISALAKLTNLKYLSLNDTDVSDISALAKLTNLEEMWLRDCPLGPAFYLTDLPAMWAKGIKVMFTEMDINIPDANLAKRIREIFKLGEGEPITTGHMRRLRELPGTGRGIADLTGLEYATQLDQLSFGDNDVSDVSALVSVVAHLPNLETLDLSFNRKLSDISALAKLTNLKTLSLDNTKLSDISALAKLTNLKTLSLGYTKVSDVSALVDLPRLEELNLWSTYVVDISELVYLTKLKTLSISGRLGHTSYHKHIPALRKKGIEVSVYESYSVVTIDGLLIPDGESVPDRGGNAFIHFEQYGKTCGPASLEMVRHYYHKRATMEDIWRAGDIHSVRLGTFPSEMDQALNELGVPAEWYDENTENFSDDPLAYLRHFVRGNRPPCILARGRTVKGDIGYHWVVVVGYNTKTDQYLFADPASRYPEPGFWWTSSATLDKLWGLKSFDDDDASFWDGGDGSNPFSGEFDAAGFLVNFTANPYTVIVPLSGATKHFKDYWVEMAYKRIEGDDVAFGGVEDWDWTTPEFRNPVDAYTVSAIRLFGWDATAYVKDHRQVGEHHVELWGRIENGALKRGVLDVMVRAYTEEGKVRSYAIGAPSRVVSTQLETSLLPNYPNPFNPETWIPYRLSDPAEVTVSIYSVDGRLVRRLELGQMPAGVYSDKERAAYWDGRNAAGEPVASGVYFYTLQAGDFKATRKMVIRK